MFEDKSIQIIFGVIFCIILIVFIKPANKKSRLN